MNTLILNAENNSPVNSSTLPSQTKAHDKKILLTATNCSCNSARSSGFILTTVPATDAIFDFYGSDVSRGRVVSRDTAVRHFELPITRF
jgi:hypothetical protein